MLTALALIESPGHVCYRYRIEAFGQALTDRGLRLEAVPLERGALSRARQLRGLRRADVVILQRKLLPLWQLLLLRRSAPTLIYDFDDAIFQRDSYAGKDPRSRQRLVRFWATVYASDAVIAGNAYLAERAAAYVERDRVVRIPTCVEPARYPVAEHRRCQSDVRLAWIGQRTTMSSLSLIRPHLAAVARRLPGIELRVICNAAPALSEIRVVPRQWSVATEAAELADADIGITWLPDDDWSRGKCGLRVLQFMAAGLPVVANPVASNCEMVEPGQTGLLAATPDEWAEGIARLAASPELRGRWGASGRRRVEQDYRVDRWAERFADVVVGAMRRSRGAKDCAIPEVSFHAQRGAA